MTDRSYRLYELSPDGRIRGAMSRSFVDDAEALEHAGRLLDNHPAVEIWQTDRLVGRLSRGREEDRFQGLQPAASF